MESEKDLVVEIISHHGQDLIWTKVTKINQMFGQGCEDWSVICQKQRHFGLWLDWMQMEKNKQSKFIKGGQAGW